MANILIHGAGHQATSWNDTISYLKMDQEILCPSLFSILDGKEATYENLYRAFALYCNNIKGSLDLCGLSLGGILALNYALDFPEKVNSLVLIGTPYKIPKFLFGIQNFIFRFLPKSVFKNMELSKQDMLALLGSMKKLNFSQKIRDINCPTLVLCGKKDGANLKSARFLAQHIKHAKLEILENTGHIVNEESPQLLAQQLDAFYLKAR